MDLTLEYSEQLYCTFLKTQLTVMVVKNRCIFFAFDVEIVKNVQCSMYNVTKLVIFFSKTSKYFFLIKKIHYDLQVFESKI